MSWELDRHWKPLLSWCWSAKTQSKVGKLPLFLSGQVLWEAKANWAWSFAGPCLSRACLGCELCREHRILRDGKDSGDAQFQPSGSTTMNHALHGHSCGKQHRKEEEKEPRQSHRAVRNSAETLWRDPSNISTRLSEKKCKALFKIQCIVKNPEEAARSPLLPHLPLRPKHIALTLDFGTATSKKGGGKSLTNIISSSNYIWWQ